MTDARLARLNAAYKIYSLHISGEIILNETCFHDMLAGEFDDNLDRYIEWQKAQKHVQEPI